MTTKPALQKVVKNTATKKEEMRVQERINLTSRKNKQKLGKNWTLAQYTSKPAKVKMGEINPYLSIITVIVSGLNSPIKRNRPGERVKS